MASTQSNPYGRITHEIQENLLIRDFTEKQLKLIDLIIRLSWSCNNEAWQYSSYKDFEVIGMYKGDVAEHLRYLQNNKVIEWIDKYNLLIFNPNFEDWKIPINKKSGVDKIKDLVHKSLKNTNEVRNLLTVLGKFSNGVRENPERFEPESPSLPITPEGSKESIKESIIYKEDEEAGAALQGDVAPPSDAYSGSSPGAVPVPSAVSDMQRVVRYFQNNIYVGMKDIERDFLVEWLELMEADALILAMEQAAKHNVKTLKYIDKILKDWNAKGVKTGEQASAAIREWEDKKNQKEQKGSKPQETRKPTFNNFKGREYTEEQQREMVSRLLQRQMDIGIDDDMKQRPRESNETWLKRIRGRD